MPTQVILDLPDKMYERVHHLAELRQQAVAEVITGVLDHALPSDKLDAEIEESAEANEALDREMQAYIAMHPLLKEKYFGQHVAVYGGQLIDHDENFDALYERVRQQYPDEIVWMSTVKAEPIETIYMRSPRFVQADNN